MNPQHKKLLELSAVLAILYYFVYQGASSMLSPVFSFAGSFASLLVAFVFFVVVLWLARKAHLEA